MRTKARWLISAVAVAGITVPIVSGGAAGATGPRNAAVYIQGMDTFVRPGLITNDYHFPDQPTVIAQGGTIVFHNQTNAPHTIALVTAGAVPKTTAEVDNCGGPGTVCFGVNNAFGFPANGNGPPSAFQVDNGKPNDDTDADADLPDKVSQVQGALIEDFDTPSSPSTVGDATVINTPRNPNMGGGMGSNRTIVVTAKPGLYHYICTLHPWMQGEIQVVK